MPPLLNTEFKPYSDAFADALEAYCFEMADAIRKHKHHDQRRSLLVNFLRQGLGLDPVEVELEKKIKAHTVRGRIDAFFQQLIIEVKTDLERERRDAERELKKYFESQDHPDAYVGLVTDGIKFEVYIYEKQAARQIRAFQLNPDSALAAFRDLDQLFFTAKRLPPAAGDIVDRFGPYSATYHAIRRSFLAAFETVREESSVKVKFREWNALLAKVYGSEIGDKTLFITHTYLAMLSRAIVTMALFPKAKRTAQMLRGIVNGLFFRQKRLANLAEPDFFSWALDTTAEQSLLEDIGRLFACLEIYNFDRLDGDILKELYQWLVAPQARHDLGEYYTPDWLAELILEKVNYKGGRLLDPACGSGSFLYAAARRLRKVTGLSKVKLVKAVVDDIIGIDVHPVAVLMAKANLLLSLREEVASYPGEISLQVYMADTLITGENRSKSALEIPVSEEQEAFHIPFETIDRGAGALDALIDRLCVFAERGAESPEKEKLALKGLRANLQKGGFSSNEAFFWRHNFRVLVALERDRRDTVWAHILKNAYRPSYLRRDKVDYIVGNPPWLAYAFIRNKTYKARVKELTFDHGLLQKTDRNLFTRMDTSTLFFCHCQRDFLNAGGIVAFVMPKSVLIPAKQHLRFQRMGFSEVLDLSDVAPLFNVRSCVLIRGNRPKTAGIPSTEYHADFQGEHNLTWVEAKKLVKTKRTQHSFAVEALEYSPYHSRFFQGATLVPRCLWFVEPADPLMVNPETPFLRTSSGAHANAKEPWTMEVEGQIEKEFLFGTVLGKDLLPFAVRRLSLVVLPVSVSRHNVLKMISPERTLAEGYVHAHDWFKRADEIWRAGQRTAMRTIDRLDYDHLLTGQSLLSQWIVLYNKSGTNISAALLTREERESIGPIPVRGFIADMVTYWFAAASENEAHYLVGILNSEVVNAAIKPLQTQGLQGERDITRRPFEACNIPDFEPTNRQHLCIAELAKAARKQLFLLVPKMDGPVSTMRGEARRIVGGVLAELDAEVAALLRTTLGPRKASAKAASQRSLFD